MRTVIELPEKLVEELDKITKKQKISRTEAIRRATEKWLSENREDNFAKAFGILRDNPVTDDELRKLREEWD